MHVIFSDWIWTEVLRQTHVLCIVKAGHSFSWQSKSGPSQSMCWDVMLAGDDLVIFLLTIQSQRKLIEKQMNKVHCCDFTYFVCRGCTCISALGICTSPAHFPQTLCVPPSVHLHLCSNEINKVRINKIIGYLTMLSTLSFDMLIPMYNCLFIVLIYVFIYYHFHLK